MIPNMLSEQTKGIDKYRVQYSFSGENEQLAVSNGIIALNGTEETFVGGDLKVTGDFFANVTSYSTTFYTMSGSEKDIILSNSVVDMTGGMVNVSSDLGQISGDSIITRIKIDDHAGSLELVLPREAASLVNCSISSQWMAENWSKWAYAECMAADVEIVEKTAY